MFFLRVIAIDQIIALIKGLEQLAQLRRMGLSIIVHSDDHISICMTQSCHQCIVLTRISGKIDDLHIPTFCCHFPQHLYRLSPIRGTIIDQYKFHICPSKSYHLFSGLIHHMLNGLI